MITRFGMKDADLVKSVALPAAPGTVTTAALDIGPKSIFRSVRNPNAFEVQVEVPALPVAVLGDAETLTVTIEASDDPAFGSGVDVLATKVFTGAGGAGAAGDTVIASPARLGKQYVRGKAVLGAGGGDASGIDIELSLAF